MANLSPDEQAVWDKLVAKVNAPEAVAKAFGDINDVLSYLVNTSDKFSANPDDKQNALDVINSHFPKATTNASE